MFKFKRDSFFPIKKKFLLSEILNLINLSIIKKEISSNFEIEDISSLQYLRNNSLLFTNKTLKNSIFESKNICVITDTDENLSLGHKDVILVNQLSDVYNLILNSIYFHDDNKNFPDNFDLINGSYISKFSEIHESTTIGINSVICRGVKVGRNCIIKNNVVIKNSIIGSDVIVCDNTSIGTSGFGFDFKKRGAKYLSPQIGIVVIEDNCHIGASCTIDRGKIDLTYISCNSMIDNLVHIAHNVFLGKNTCIAAQTGISGSVKIGDNVTIGGQAGLAGHIDIGDNVIIAAKSGVTKNIKDNSTVAGFPAIDINLWKKKIIREKKNGYKQNTRDLTS